MVLTPWSALLHRADTEAPFTLNVSFCSAVQLRCLINFRCTVLNHHGHYSPKSSKALLLRLPCLGSPISESITPSDVETSWSLHPPTPFLLQLVPTYIPILQGVSTQFPGVLVGPLPFASAIKCHQKSTCNSAGSSVGSLAPPPGHPTAGRCGRVVPVLPLLLCTRPTRAWPSVGGQSPPPAPR
jgi:hypothetical protein